MPRCPLRSSGLHPNHVDSVDPGDAIGCRFLPAVRPTSLPRSTRIGGGMTPRRRRLSSSARMGPASSTARSWDQPDREDALRERDAQPRTGSPSRDLQQCDQVRGDRLAGRIRERQRFPPASSPAPAAGRAGRTGTHRAGRTRSASSWRDKWCRPVEGTVSRSLRPFRPRGRSVPLVDDLDDDQIFLDVRPAPSRHSAAMRPASVVVYWSTTGTTRAARRRARAVLVSVSPIRDGETRAHPQRPLAARHGGAISWMGGRQARRTPLLGA
jgi:hypothetical protein